MAITKNGVFLDRLSSALIPSGADIGQPTVKTISPEYCREETIEVPRATVETAVKATTFENVINDVTVGVDKQILDIVTADYIATNDVEYDYSVLTISSNKIPSTSTEFYTNVADVYKVLVELNVKTS